MLGGMAVSLFSKPLTLLIGLLIVGVQVHSPFSFCSFSFPVSAYAPFAIADRDVETVCRVSTGHQSHSLRSHATLLYQH